MAGLLLLWLVMEKVCTPLKEKRVALFSDNTPTISLVSCLVSKKSRVAELLVHALTYNSSQFTPVHSYPSTLQDHTMLWMTSPHVPLWAIWHGIAKYVAIFWHCTPPCLKKVNYGIWFPLYDCVWEQFFYDSNIDFQDDSSSRKCIMVGRPKRKGKGAVRWVRGAPYLQCPQTDKSTKQNTHVGWGGISDTISVFPGAHPHHQNYSCQNHK